MGNCIGKKSCSQNQHQCSSHKNHQLNKTSIASKQIDVKLSRQNILLINKQEDIAMGYLFSKQEIRAESFDPSPSPSIFDTSFSSDSHCNSTSFSSQDQLIISSSSSIDTNPFSHSSNESSTNEPFSAIFPVSTSRTNNNSFLHEFHKHTVAHNCKTLSSIIDDVVQQQFIRIHRQTKTILIEHQQLQCTHINDRNQFDQPHLVFDDEQKLVYLTKYINDNDFQSITINIPNSSQQFSSCDCCSLILSSSKLHEYLRSFLIVNTTYNLISLCFNQINNSNHLFGYISQINRNYIQQIIINSSRLSYSYDLHVDYRNFYFVIRMHSWPDEIRSMYEKRKRLWPIDTQILFDKTCFIRYYDNESITLTDKKCSNCERISSTISNSSWTYTYTFIEDRLISLMSEGQLRFASILWNYLNGKTEGKFSYKIYKHLLFYFLENYSSDSFTTSDLLSHISFFIDYLFNCLQKKSIQHYFNTKYNLYNETISTISLISFKISYKDLKYNSIYMLPKSSLYVYQLMYIIQFQTEFLQSLSTYKTNLTQMILDTHELVIKQLSLGVKTYKKQLDCTTALQLCHPLTLDHLYACQEENVHLVLDYLSLLREKEPSLIIHSHWSIFIQYLNSLFDHLFIS